MTPNTWSLGQYQKQTTDHSNPWMCFPMPAVNILIGALLLLISLSAFAHPSYLPAFQQVFDHQKIVMLMIDPKTGQILEANPAAAKFYGYSQSQLEEMTTQQINELTPQQIAEEKALSVTEGRDFFIFRHKLANGENRTVEVHSQPYSVEGKTLLLWMIQDFSSRKDLEKGLLGYQKSLEKTVELQKQQIKQEKQRQIHLLWLGLLLQMLLIGYLVYDLFRRKRLQKALKRSQEGLQEARLQLEATMDAIPDLFFELDETGRILVVHTSETEKLYIPPDEFLGKRYQDVLPPNVVTVCTEAFDEVRETGHSRGKQYEIDLPEGKHYFELSVSSKLSSDGHRHFIALARDITERIKAQQHLKLTANVFNYAREGITITDVDGNVIDVNKGFTEITGYKRQDILGKNPRIMKSNLQPASFYKEMWQDIEQKGYWSGEMWNRHKDGHIYAEDISISCIYDDQGKVINYLGIFSDITAIKENQKRLEHMAHFDVLTQLPNRLLLSDRLQQALIHSERNWTTLAVLFVDLDGFKEVNDLYGHDIGDQLLVKVSEKMHAALRAEDTLARMGGDEFVAVLSDLDSPQACEPVLERFLSAVSEPILIDDNLVQVSASIGVAIYPDDLADADMLIRHADQAMYLAKQEGKNRYRFFDVNQDEMVKSQTALIEEISHAIQNDEFVLYYQPKADLKTGEISGVEALVRWQHPQKGLLYPDEFLPAIHDHPLSMDLDEWVMKRAMKQWEEWQGQDLKMSISVNVSARSLQLENFTQRIEYCHTRYPGLSEGALELEVLETSALEKVDHVRNLMLHCQGFGIGFALDDFGTGYSSLTYLRRLPAQLIKIDQSFVRNMLEDKEDKAIVEGVLRLTDAFGLEVIAEGVETIEHCKALYDMGCYKVQGYAIARPMPAKDVPNWVSVVSGSAIQHIASLMRDV